MSEAYITEYPELQQDTLGRDMLVGKGRGLQNRATFTGTPGLSTTFAADMHIIRLHVNAACHIAFGTAPVATTNDAKLAANQTEFFSIIPGDKISLIDA